MGSVGVRQAAMVKDETRFKFGNKARMKAATGQTRQLQS
jgi:hypothetical protein